MTTRRTIEPRPLDFHFFKSGKDHPDWKRLHEEAVELAREIAPLIHTDDCDTVVDRTADRVRKAKSLATAGNNYLINRKRWAAGNHALRPMYFIWTMLYSCNFRCSYCDDHRGSHYYDLKDKPLDFAKRVEVLKTMRTGTSAIYFCGGEPTIDPDLPVFTDIAYNLGYHPLMINSNGYVLNNALKKIEWRKWLRQMDVIIISLDGLEIPRLQELWGVKKVEQVLVNLLMLRELRQVVDFKLIVNAVVDNNTVKMASDVMDFVHDLGDVWFVPVPANDHDHPGGTFSFERDMINRPDYAALAEKILERQAQGHLVVGSKRIMENLLKIKPYLCLPTLRPHVDPDGRIAWPCRATKNVEPTYVNVLDYDNLDQVWDAANSIIPARDFHGMGPKQCGTTCAWMQNYTTARYHDLLVDPLNSGIVSEIKDFAFKTR